MACEEHPTIQIPSAPEKKTLESKRLNPILQCRKGGNTPLSFLLQKKKKQGTWMI
jgi:hypothetical protein